MHMKGLMVFWFFMAVNYAILLIINLILIPILLYYGNNPIISIFGILLCALAGSQAVFKYEDISDRVKERQRNERLMKDIFKDY